jgi:hypothetical protein
VVHVASNRRARHDRLPTRGATALIAAAPGIGRPCSDWADGSASFHIYILFCPLLLRHRPHPAFPPAFPRRLRSPAAFPPAFPLSPALPGCLLPGLSTVACAFLRSPAAFPPAFPPSPALPGRLSPGFLPVACAPRPPFTRLSPRRLRSPAAFPPAFSPSPALSGRISPNAEQPGQPGCDIPVVHKQS